MAQRVLNFADGFESSSSPSSSGSTGGGGEVDNLGMTLAAGLFTITAADGTALSGSNMATIKIRATTDGMVKSLSVDVATHHFEDATGTSDIIGEEFGVTTGVVWDEDRPFYLYAVNTDDTNSGVYFAISPDPSASMAPDSTNDIAYNGNPATNNTDKTFYFMTDDNVAVAGTVGKPAKLIGGIRMQMDVSDDWTVQAVSGSEGDGISTHPYVAKAFVFPQGQNGAVAASYLSAGGGTIPVWATPASFFYRYKVALSGDITCTFSTISAGNVTNGVGANNVLLHLPYQITEAMGFFMPIGHYNVTGGQDGKGIMIGQSVNAQKSLSLSDSIRNFLFATDFSATNDDIDGRFTYQAFFE